MNKAAVKKQSLEKGRMLPYVALPSGGPVADGLNLRRRNTSSSQQCSTTSTQGMARNRRGRESEAETSQESGASRNGTICTDAKKRVKGKTRSRRSLAGGGHWEIQRKDEETPRAARCEHEVAHFSY